MEDGLASLYMNKAIAVSALGDSRGAVALYGKAIVIRERLVNIEGRSELAGKLAWVKAYRAIAMIQLGETEKGKREALNTISILRSEIKRTGRSDLTTVLKWLESQIDNKL